MPAWEGILEPEIMVSVTGCKGVLLWLWKCFLSASNLRSCDHFILFFLHLCSGYGGLPNGGQLLGLGSNGNKAGKYGKSLALVSLPVSTSYKQFPPLTFHCFSSSSDSPSLLQVMEECLMKLNPLDWALKPNLLGIMVKTWIREILVVT